MGLEELIRTKGYTYNSLAKVIGKSTMTIKRWADGVNEPNCSDIIKLSQVLKTPIATIVKMIAKK